MVDCGVSFIRNIQVGHNGKYHSLFSQHGLLALFFGVLVEQLGAPIPALPFLLLAGVAAADNGVFAVQALAVATLASMIADSVWFYAGRRFGHRVLALLCRISISPDTCVRQSELSFARRGIATLVVAKFVPGLSILTPPLAGAMGMRVSSFVIFNIAGTLLWAGSGIAGRLTVSQSGRATAGLPESAWRYRHVAGCLWSCFIHCHTYLAALARETLGGQFAACGACSAG
jgi:membrane protein DedA with SNARE-associated domain